MQAPLRHDLLNQILSQPTAPFREGRVRATIQDRLIKHGVPHFLDPVGNLVIGAENKAHYLKQMKLKTSEPLRFYMAHMDHPGFHGTAWKSKTELLVKWHGGSPTEHLDGSSVWLAHQKNGKQKGSPRPEWHGKGVLKNPQLLESGRALDTGTVLVDLPSLETQALDPKTIFGGFNFRAPVWQDGNLIYTKAADDLIGCFTIVSLAIDLWANQSKSPKKGNRSRKIPPPFLAILTRAEEVGFIGALGHFDLGWLKSSSRPIVVISLETSRTLPGADIGKGPVVRLGDRATVFDPGYTQVLTDLALLNLPHQHQRRIMDGGSCEATAATVYGYRCIGISVPLGNYHNQSFEGGPDAAPSNGPAPEFVHLNDVARLLTLCRALLKPKLPWDQPWKKKQSVFKKSLRDYRPLMRSGV